MIIRYETITVADTCGEILGGGGGAAKFSTCMPLVSV